jgi:hypothetical protein
MRGKEAAVVFKVVYSNLETVGGEFLSQFGRNLVTSFGNKIERRAKSKLHLDLHQ